MDREVNIESILALDAQIMKLKRTRNSLLNISRIPPEILGRIFQFIVTPKFDNPHFPKVEEGSYKFLLVCHHWNEVARRTPELWNSWGNSLPEWRRLCLKNGISALDLMLEWTPVLEIPGVDQTGLFDDVLRNALRDRAARDVVRKVHLGTWNRELTTSILSSLTPEGEDIRRSSIESIVLWNADLSGFFARHRFPKLRNLSLYSCTSSSLDSLKSHTTALVNFTFCDTTKTSSCIPTVSQILSIFASNPNIRTLELASEVFNDNSKHGRVPLRRLESIAMSGGFRQIFPILNRLEFQTTMNETTFTWFSCTPEDIRRVIGPYIRDYLDDVGFKNRLGVSLNVTWDSILLEVSIVGDGFHGPERLPQRALPRAKFRVCPSQAPPGAGLILRADIFAQLPKERIVYFETSLGWTESMIIAMPSLEFLCLTGVVVSDGFLLPEPGGPNANKKLLPSLRRLYIQPILATYNNWNPLVHFLTQQTDGGQPISLSVFDNTAHICVGVLKQIENLVEEFTYLPHLIVPTCPLPECVDEAWIYESFY